MSPIVDAARLPIRGTIALASSLVDQAPGRLILLVAVEAALLVLGQIGVDRLAVPDPWSQVAQFVVQQIVFALMTGAIVTVAHAAAERRPCGIAAALRTGVARFAPMLLVCSAIDIAALLTLPPYVPFNTIASVIVGLLFAVATPACVIERLGPRASLSRSLVLTRGNRGQIFGLGLLCSLVVSAGLAVGILLYFGLANLVDPLWLHAALVVLAVLLALPAILFVVAVALVGALLPTAIYLNLRAIEMRSQRDADDVAAAAVA